MMKEYHISSLDEVSCGDYHMRQRPDDEDCLFCATNAFYQAVATEVEGSLGVVLKTTDNCYLSSSSCC